MEQQVPENKSTGFKYLIIPCSTVFISSFCIMVIELVAGRLIAKFLGSSLYTWTSVIGVVLAGITIGNYIGGRIADKTPSRKALAALFALAAFSCVVIIMLNNVIGEWVWLWQFSWPVRIFMHVSVVFLLPSALLGTISPVVAKMALERGLPTGRTVGDIYAWGAAGSIAGTFAAGYYLIAAMGTTMIIWGAGGVLILMALLYGISFWFFRSACFFFLLIACLGIAPWQWTKQMSEKVLLRAKPDPTILYEDETEYCYVTVKTFGGDPKKKVFTQDKLVHSSIDLNNMNSLQYTYEQMMVAITQRYTQENNSPSFMILGGGGYVLPRYIKNHWPQSKVEVVEIDPGVTKAAYEAFHLDPSLEIKTISLDARNYVDHLNNQQELGKEVQKYDFIYEDALNDFSVPFQLTTDEFNKKLFNILNDNGVYLIELIDTLDSGLFLGSMINTLKLTFPFVEVLTENNVPTNERNTFVIVAAKKELNLANVCVGFDVNKNVQYLNEDDYSKLRTKTNQLVLKDNYAPVENLLAPVVERLGIEGKAMYKDKKARQVAEDAEKFAWKGNLAKTLQKLDKLVELDPSVSVRSYMVMAAIFADRNRTNSAIEIYKAAVNKFTDEKFKNQMSELRGNYAVLLNKIGKYAEAKEEFAKVEADFNEMVQKKPATAVSLSQIGNMAAELEEFKKAVFYFKKAVELSPLDFDRNMELIQAMHIDGDVDGAIGECKSSLDRMQKENKIEDANKIGTYLKNLEKIKEQKK
jgi:predicted membrane-bound spermidine synthase/Tfp pilus assembly protein PilF